MKQKKIIVVGSANMDMVATVARFPEPGETVFGHQFAMYPGGKGANQAVCCAKLGAETYFIGKMGQDVLRDRLVHNMSQAGVQLQGLLSDENAATGIALITIDAKGENEIVVVSGSNMKLSAADVASQGQLFHPDSVVLAQLEIPMETVVHAAELAKAAGALFILNPAPAQVLPPKLLSLIDYITPNRIELELLAGLTIGEDEQKVRAAADRLISQGVQNVLVTLGKTGAMWVNADGAQTFTGRKVTAVDTTAAGDAFNGAFAMALSQGEAVAQAIVFANQVAAFSVTRMGAQSSMPTLAEIKPWIQAAAG
jgi:ribokinase